jgi:acyl-coenzyme A synthetase/AMP-(fatty) acid ligase
MSRHLAGQGLAIGAACCELRVPQKIEFIQTLPMTTTGKVQRRVLSLREARRLCTADEAPP